MKKTLLLLAALAAALGAGAQTFPNYALGIENTTWQSIASTGTRLTQVYNTYEQQISLPFDLEFGGATVPQGQTVKVSARGRVNLGQYGAYNYAYTHWNMPSAEFAIIPFFVNMVEMPRNSSSCYWLTRDDDRGGQELVVEWNGLRRYGASGDNVSYQLHIHSNGDIAVCYGPMTLQAGYWDTIFTFAVVHDNASDRILTTGHWNTDSSIVLANPSSIGSTPLMVGVPQEGLILTMVRPLPPCPHPTHLAANQVWHEGATLHWGGNGVSGAQYLVQYSTSSFTPGSPLVPTHTVSDTSYLVTSLQPDQQYYACVRSDCGADTSRWESVQFQTSCIDIAHADLPYTQQFESAASAACWRKLGTVNFSSQTTSGGVTERFCNLFFLDSYAIMPPIDYVNDLQVSFRVKSGPVMVGVMDDPTDTATFVPIHECFSNGAAWNNYTVRFNRYDGYGRYIAFRAWPNEYGVGGCYIDDVLLEPIQGCLPVESLHVESHSDTSAVVLWTDYDSTNLYRVQCIGGTTFFTDTVATQGITLTGLAPETQYVVTVRTLCDSATASTDTTVNFSTYPSCMKPLAVTVDSVTRSTARVHWTEPNSLGTYRVVLRPSPLGTDTISAVTVVGDTVCLLTGLPSVRRYRVDVSQLCSGTWTDSEWETFDNDYSCPGPQGVAVDSVTSTTAVITVSDSGGADHLVILTTGYQSDTLNVTTPQFILTGLQPASQYTIRVYSRCADSTFSDFVSATFATACSMVTHADLPYVEDFDNAIVGSVNSLSPCWSFRSFAPSNYTGMYRPDGGQYHGATGHSLYVLAQQPDWPFFIALPEVDSLDDLMLKLWVYCNWSGDSKIDFGIMSNPADTTTFQVIDTYIPAVSQKWVEVSVPFRGYGSMGHYPAMRVGVVGSTFGDPFFLDDITLTFNLSCGQPDSLTIAALTDTSALLAIHPATGADSDAVAYQVVLSSFYGDDTLTVTDTLVDLAALHPATDYSVSVRSFCPEGGVTLATSLLFTTPCGALRLPWSEGFENSQIYHMPRCWELADTGSNTIDVRSTPIIAHGGSMLLHSGFSSEDSYVSYLTPEFAATDAPVVLSYYARGIELAGWADTSFIQLGISFVTSSDDTVFVFSDKVLMPEWTLCRHVLPAGALSSGGRFLFHATHVADSSSYPAYLQLDDLSVQAACLPVDSLVVATADTVPAGFTAYWQPQGAEQGWTVHMWSDTSDTSFTSSTPYTHLSTSPSTDYCLTVEPLCPPQSVTLDSLSADTVCFSTPAAPQPQGIADEADGGWSVAIHPNPAHGDVTVTATGGEWTVEILDLAGRTVLSATKVSSTHRTLTVSSLQPGAYFVRIVTGEKCRVEKLVVM